MQHRFVKQHFETLYKMKYRPLMNQLFLSHKTTVKITADGLVNYTSFSYIYFDKSTRSTLKYQ